MLDLKHLAHSAKGSSEDMNLVFVNDSLATVCQLQGIISLYIKSMTYEVDDSGSICYLILHALTMTKYILNEVQK